MTCEKGSITIPQDIIIHILCRLPVKFVGRFRCVSKEWLCLLSEPEFIKTYQKTHNRNHFIFYSGSLYSVPFDNHEAVSTLTKPLSDKNNAYIYGSCNGLVLAYDLHDAQTFVILNQTTREYVQFLNVSLRSNTWRRVSDSPYEHFYGDASSGVFVNGLLHWVARKGSDVVLAAFSLADEKFSEVPSPVFYNDVNTLSDNVHCKLVALGEKLAIFHEVKGVVWLMNEYRVKESWTKIVLCGFNKIPMSKFKTYILI
ncbi:F-box associated interaction domain-containing protein [Artemisia annua]|uniref:F-box associated interaction domain-containing protein n=1 Tax=Artemisia annua TaxID=35608 RepID=A0A2U1PEU3_ARTAN|nr:F-box associated interaction domain-containing protein [Artemisia annua]